MVHPSEEQAAGAALLARGMAQSEVATVAFGSHGRIVAANPVAERWVGAPPGGLIGRTVRSVGGSLADEDWPAFWRALREAGRLTLTATFVAADGVLYTAPTEASWLGDPAGGPGHAFFVYTRRAPVVPDGPDDGRLTRLRHVAAFLGEGFADLDLVTGALTVGRRIGELLGQVEGSLRRLEDLRSISPPEDSAALEAMVERLRRGEADELSMRLRVCHPERGLRWLAVRARAAGRGPDGAAVRLVGYAFDITERVQAEERAQRSERRLRAVLDRLAVGVLLVGPHGEFELANPAAEALLGLGSRGFDGRVWDDHGWDVVDEAGRPVPREALPVPRAIAGGAPVRDVVLGVAHEGAPERVWLLVSAEPALADDGSVADVLCHYTDISARMRLERMLRETHRMESIGRLAGGVAHDFNNLLTVILGGVDLALGTLPPNHPAVDDLGEIRRAATRAGRLTHALLGYARKQYSAPRRVWLDAVVGECAGLIERALGEAISLVIEADADLAPVRLDPRQFEQVLLELAVNARHAMPGGGRLSIEIHDVELPPDDPRWPRMAAGAYVLLAVSDTGHGVAPAIADRVFEPFFSTRPVGQGTGLGLANCQGVVRQHHGDIRLVSAPGAGARFEILLPIAAGAS